MQLQVSIWGGSKKGASDLPELVDPELELELEWKMRFPEQAMLSARRELTTDDQDTGVSLVLGRDDQINLTVSKLNEVDLFVRSRLDEMQNKDRTLIFYTDEQLNLFLRRIISLLDGKRVCSGGELQAELYAFASRILAIHETPVLLHSTDDLHLGSHFSAFSSFLMRMDDTDVPSGLNVYNDAVPLDQVNKALDVMQMVRLRTLRLLEEWPEHPTLRHVLLLMQRMGQFSLSSPLMKFVSGFEMLLAQLQEWEKNAATHVSMAEELTAVCNLLTNWRKLELKCWLSSLDAALDKAASRALPFWFHVHDLFLLPTGDEEESAKSIVQLMENGPVAEYKQRLSILRSICFALKFWPDIATKKRERRLQLLCNLTWFYGQFEQAVDQFLSKQRLPIEREMRNFVRIMRWGIFEEAIPLQVSFAGLSEEAPVFSITINAQRTVTECTNEARIMKLIKRMDGHSRAVGESDKPWMKCISALSLLHLEWLQSVQRLSQQTKELASSSPKAHILKHLASPNETEVLDADEQEIAKAKVWRQQYTALQQQKRLLLASWIKLAERAKCQSQEKENFEHFGLSSTRGQRLASFADSSNRMHFLAQLPATCAEVLSPDAQKHSSTYEALHAFRRLLALRSCVPNCPEESDMIQELGGPSTVSKLLGLLDDLVHQSADCWLKLLGSVHAKRDQLAQHTVAPLMCRPGQMHFLPASTVTQLRRHRNIIAETASQLQQDLANFWTAVQIAADKLNNPELVPHLVTDYSSVLHQAGLSEASVPNCQLPEIFLSAQDVAQTRAQLEPKMDQLLGCLCVHVDENLSKYLKDELHSQQNAMEGSLVELTATLSQLQSLFGQTIVPNFQGRLQSMDEALHAIKLLLSADAPQTTENAAFADKLETIVTRILSLAEKLILVDKEAECDDLLTAIGNYGNTWVSQILPQICSIERAVARLKRSVTSTEQLCQMASLGLLLDAVSDLLKLREQQLWRLFAEWCGIGISFSQILAQLFTQGFCKVKGATEGAGSGPGTGTQSDTAGEGEEQDGCTSLGQEMAGDEAAGARDVSEQIECQEQIEGLAQPQQQEQKDEGSDDAPPQAQDQGIEMPDDFAGQHEEGTLGEEDEKPPELDDERMAEEEQENQQNEGLNSEMWASEDEQEDAGKDKAAAEDEAKHGGVDDQRQNKQRPEEESKGDIQDMDEQEPGENDDQTQDAKGSEKPAAQQKRNERTGENVAKDDQDPEGS
ncbi:AAA ATPase midasin [Cichlidogyrus casuarinus]|uniref:AAA ATPase midasin n=1 Tax=Cichlidogyrus casuarinus TaxID=1844966 RepID=A0ABD2Q909_9PLAT